MQGKNDLFAIVIIFKTMLNDHSFENFYKALDMQMKELAHKLSTISITTVENAMGFISNWRDLKPAPASLTATSTDNSSLSSSIG